MTVYDFQLDMFNPSIHVATINQAPTTGFLHRGRYTLYPPASTELDFRSRLVSLECFRGIVHAPAPFLDNIKGVGYFRLNCCCVRFLSYLELETLCYGKS